MVYEQNPNKIGCYFIKHRAEPRQRGKICLRYSAKWVWDSGTRLVLGRPMVLQRLINKHVESQKRKMMQIELYTFNNFPERVSVGKRGCEGVRISWRV